jgi:hypothetical protein
MVLDGAKLMATIAAVCGCSGQSHEDNLAIDRGVTEGRLRRLYDQYRR